MADVIVNAEVRSNVGQLNQDLRQTQQEAITLKDAFGVAGSAISVLQGGMKLFGIESSKTQKAILQVQSAMALNQGIQSLMKQKDAIIGIASFVGKWTGATKVLTVAQKALNLVMKANPIGLLIAGITALVGLGSALVKFFKNSAAATKEETEAVVEQNKALAANNDERLAQIERDEELMRHQERMSELNGMTIREYYDMLEANKTTSLESARASRDSFNQQIKDKKKYLEQLRKDNDEESEIVQSTKKLYKDLFADREQAQAKIDELKKELRQLDRDEEFDRAKQQKENAKRREEFEEKEEKKRKDKALRIKKERIAANKQFLATLRKMNQEAALEEIKDDQERELKKAEQERDNELKRLEKSKVGDKVRAAMKEAIELEHQNKMKAINKKFEDEAEEERKEREKILQDLIKENNANAIKDELEFQLEELRLQKEAELEKLKVHENFAQLKLEIDKKYKRLEQETRDEAEEKEKEGLRELNEFRLDLAAQALDVFMTNIDTRMMVLEQDHEKEVELAEEQGKDTTAINEKFDKQKEQLAKKQKRIKIAMATMDMYSSAVGAYNQAMGLPQPTGLVMAPIAAAMAVVAGLANINSIMKADVGGGGGGGGGGSMTAATPAPQMVSGSFDLQNLEKPEPLKAFVVTDELTSSQAQLANIRRRATI